jgi:hypothetical protein
MFVAGNNDDRMTELFECSDILAGEIQSEVSSSGSESSITAGSLHRSL